MNIIIFIDNKISIKFILSYATHNSQKNIIDIDLTADNKVSVTFCNVLCSYHCVRYICFVCLFFQNFNIVLLSF